MDTFATPDYPRGKLQLCVAEGEMTAFVCVCVTFPGLGFIQQTYLAPTLLCTQLESRVGASMSGNAQLLPTLGACPLHACESHNLS